MTQKLVSIIVPAYNEEAVLDIFHARISAVLATLPDYAWEILFINDGSTDATQLKIEALQRHDPRVGSILLSRNFGKEIAMTAGLDHAKGDAVVIIDADLQDPPELIMTSCANGTRATTWFMVGAPTAMASPGPRRQRPTTSTG